MNDKHKIDDNLSLEDLRETLTSCSQNDTTQTASTTQTQENSQEATNGGNESANVQQEAKNTQATDEASTQQAQTLIHKYESYSLGEFIADLTPMEYPIDKWIQAEGLHMIFGEPGSYKTFAVVDMCGHIACEDFVSWCGKSIEHGGVYYLAGEGVQGLKKRFAGWCLEHNKNPKDIPIHISPEPFTLDDKTPEHNIESTIANIRAVCPNVKLVVVDTLNRYMSGEENSATDMGAFILACSKLQRELHCAVLIVHHSGLAQESKGRGRGSGALHGAVDIEIQCVKSGMTCTLTQTRNKEAEKDKPISFDMKEIEIPGVKNKKGNYVRTTTLVPFFNEEATKTLATAEPEPKKPKLGKAKQFALDTFREAAKNFGEIIIDNPETGHEIIRLENSDWQKHFYEQLPIKNEEDPKKEKERKRVTFYNAKEYMTTEAKILTIQRVRGYEYYCLDLSGNIDAAYRGEIRIGIKNREKAQAEKSTTANDTGAEAERTADMFKD